MFKRVRWMSMGAAAGVGASVWAQYRLRRTLDEHPTARVTVQAAAKARRVSIEVREAILDGRDAMVARETALRSELDSRLVPIRPDPEPLVPPTARRSGRRLSPEGGAVGARLRVVDAASERLGPDEAPPDHRSSFGGHPSLGSGGRPALSPAVDEDAPVARRGQRRRRRRDG